MPVYEVDSMPVYVYKCLECNKYIEVLQGINDEPLKTCESVCEEPYSDSSGPKSGSRERVLQPVHTVFKGPGFYENDYKNKR